jgi:hypothetical protein
LNVSATLKWEKKMTPMELGEFFASDEVENFIDGIGFQVVDAVEAIMATVDKPSGSEVHTARTIGSGGNKIYWSTDPEAVAGRILVKPPNNPKSGTRWWPLTLPDGTGSIQLIGLVVADHPNSENYQYGMNGFPNTRFFTGAMAQVAANTGSKWTEFE